MASNELRFGYEACPVSHELVEESIGRFFEQQDPPQSMPDNIMAVGVTDADHERGGHAVRLLVHESDVAPFDLVAKHFSGIPVRLTIEQSFFEAH